MRVLATVAFLIVCPLLEVRAEVREVDWPRGVRFSASEKKEVIALAKAMGVHDPVKVSMGVVLILGDRFVTVDGRVTVDGPERRWARARMFRENWRGPGDAPPPELRRHRVGRWISMGEGEVVSEWRIQDGSWFVDLSLGPDVSYDDAQRIVLALRHGTFTNRLPERLINGAMVRPSFQLDNRGQASSIQRDGAQAYKVSYWVGDYSGYTLSISLSEGKVLLLAVSVFEV
jgi:hypothetical protein